MTRREATLTAIMLVQQLEDTQWEKWSDKSPIHTAKNGNCSGLLKELVNKLSHNNIETTEAYGIVHDKDKIVHYNIEQMKQNIQNKPPHVHCLFKFSKGATLNKLALAMGVEPQYLEKLKSGRYGYDNCLAYLVHAKDETKYQYPPEQVVTVLGENYTDVYHRNMETWVQGRATKKAKATNASVDWLVDEIIHGKINKETILLTASYYEVYAQHKRRINEALETYTEKKSYQTINDLDEGKLKKTTLFITGKSGSGKTKFGRLLIDEYKKLSEQHGTRWETCLTASTNPLDDYAGEDILFLDDVMGESLAVADWLKLLDPYMINPISARYHNKVSSAKLIIITNTHTPIEFFVKAKQYTNTEDIGQFIRRIDCLVHIGDTIKLSQSQKSNESEQYSHVFSESLDYSEENALTVLLNTVAYNMQWNNKKSPIPTQFKATEKDSNNSEIIDRNHNLVSLLSQNINQEARGN